MFFVVVFTFLFGVCGVPGVSRLSGSSKHHNLSASICATTKWLSFFCSPSAAYFGPSKRRGCQGDLTAICKSIVLAGKLKLRLVSDSGRRVSSRPIDWMRPCRPINCRPPGQLRRQLMTHTWLSLLLLSECPDTPRVLCLNFERAATETQFTCSRRSNHQLAKANTELPLRRRRRRRRRPLVLVSHPQAWPQR